MKRILILAGIIGGAVLLIVQMSAPQSAVTVTNAQAMAMGANPNMFMVSLTMQNDGDPVTLRSASSPSGATVSIMAQDPDAELVVPAGMQGQLATDGAHLMLAVSGDDFPEGSYHAITLSFDDGSSVPTRVLRAGSDGMAMMDHGQGAGVEGDPTPVIAFDPPPTIAQTGFDVTLSLENFDFVRTSDDAPHVAGQGHGHIYLNGLKLGRLYDRTFSIGALPFGSYTLRVALNSNDHRPYTRDGAPIDAILEFEFPDPNGPENTAPPSQ